MSYLGQVFRRPKPSAREIVNRSWEEFTKSRGISFSRKYGRVQSTFEFGVRSACKYDKHQPVLNESAWTLSYEFTHAQFSPQMSGSRVMSQDEVLQEMNLNSSCGWPWNLQFANKREFLSSEVGQQALFESWRQLGKRDSNYRPFWCSTQKDEIRTTEKVAAGNVRTFTASSVDCSVNTNRLFLDQNNRFYAGVSLPGRDWWSSVGMTKFAGGWHHLWQRLSNFGTWLLGYELDETEYDSSIFKQAMFGQRELRKEFLCSGKSVEDVAELVTRVDQCYDHIINSVIVLDGDAESSASVVEKSTGNPSGSSCTVVDNTMVLFRLFAYAFIIGWRQHEGSDPTYRNFMDNVCAALYGDDNTYTVSNRCNWFTPAFIAGIWSAIGVHTKTPCATARPVEELRFLSQGFVKCRAYGTWLPLPDTDKVLGSLHVGSKCEAIQWHYLRACALYLDSWANLELRSVLSDYLDWLMQENRSAFIGEVNGVRCEDILGLRKSEIFYSALYSGRESSAEHPKSCFELMKTAALKTSPDENSLYTDKLPIDDILRLEVPQSAHMPNQKPKSKPKGKKPKRAFKTLTKIRGRGDYLVPASAVKNINGQPVGAHLGAVIGSAFGGRTGAEIGRTVGGYAHRLVKTVTGWGDYNGRLNETLRARGAKGNLWLKGAIPEFGRAPSMDGATVLKFHDYVGDVLSSTAFASTTYNVNPGLDASFPYLGSMARKFQQYECLGCIYQFRSTCGTGWTGSVPNEGVVVLTSNYNVIKPPFNTLVQAENTEFYTETKPDTSAFHMIECDPKQRGHTLYNVRGGPVQTFEYEEADLCNLQVITSGQSTAGVSLGQLEVTYLFAFYKPTGAGDPNFDYAAVYNAPSATTVTTFAGAAAFTGGIGVSRPTSYYTFGTTSSSPSITIAPDVYGVFNFIIQGWSSTSTWSTTAPVLTVQSDPGNRTIAMSLSAALGLPAGTAYQSQTMILAGSWGITAGSSPITLYITGVPTSAAASVSVWTIQIQRTRAWSSGGFPGTYGPALAASAPAGLICAPGSTIPSRMSYADYCSTMSRPQVTSQHFEDPAPARSLSIESDGDLEECKTSSVYDMSDSVLLSAVRSLTGSNKKKTPGA